MTAPVTHQSPPIVLRLSVTPNGFISTELRVRKISRHASKSSMALDRHAQRLMDARKATEASLAPRKLPKAERPAVRPPDAPVEYSGEQMLFVHFIPPSLRKPGKEKVPWIVHCTRGSGCCREAMHVSFRSVTDFETAEGAALGQTCKCFVAQHHLRGIGCLRWEDEVAVIESTQIAERGTIATQTEQPSTFTRSAQTLSVHTCAAQAQTEDDALETRCDELTRKTAKLSTALREARASAQAAEIAQQQAQRDREHMARDHEAEVARMRAQIAKLEARDDYCYTTASSTSTPRKEVPTGVAGVERKVVYEKQRAHLLEVVASRLQQQLDELKRAPRGVEWVE